MKKLKIKKMHIFAMAINWPGFSGGDRILIELTKRWSRKFPITIYSWVQGVNMFKEQKLKKHKKLNFRILYIPHLLHKIFLLNYITRVIVSIWKAINLKIDNSDDNYIFSASEFWMDSLPCIVLKIKYPRVRWTAAWYQTAPNPLKGYSEAKRSEKHYLKAFIYWLVQLPIKPLISKYADRIIVNNEKERLEFPKHKQKNIIVLIGAVNVAAIHKFLINRQSSDMVKSLKFDAVFQGRFHPQKGVVELIDIWKKVVDKIPNARLAMIGDGPLHKVVKTKINKLKLDKNVELFGYVFDGHKKYNIFANSEIVLHPAFYDSGGMASAEAMAFGLPAVGFDLKAYKSYYPSGMVKIKKGNKGRFADAIINLLNNKNKRKKLGKEAKSLVENNMNWDKRAIEVLSKLQ
jgi:glycosyltransferase involved in cell wall biosynthesis